VPIERRRRRRRTGAAVPLAGSEVLARADVRQRPAVRGELNLDSPMDGVAALDAAVHDVDRDEVLFGPFSRERQTASTTSASKMDPLRPRPIRAQTSENGLTKPCRGTLVRGAVSPAQSHLRALLANPAQPVELLWGTRGPRFKSGRPDWNHRSSASSSGRAPDTNESSST
jgi:hypothetical protein